MKKKNRLLSIILLTVLLVLSVVAVSAATTRTVKLKKGKTVTVYVSKGEKVKLSAKSGLKWTSSKKSVVTVKKSGNAGIVTAKKTGTATIKAVKGKTKFTCTLIVESPSITRTSLTMTEGDGTRLYVYGTKQKVKWDSKNPSVATVSSDGLVVGASHGVAIITATVGSKVLACRVTVNPKSQFIPANTPTPYPTSAPVRVVTPTPIPAPVIIQTPTPIPAPVSTIGTRENPYNAFNGATVPLYSYRNNKGTFYYKVKNCVVGDSAKEKLNRFDKESELPSDMTWVYLEFNFKYISGSDEVSVSDILWYTDFYNSDSTKGCDVQIKYMSYIEDSPITHINDIKAYPGADTDFYMIFAVKSADLPLTFRLTTGYDEEKFNPTYSWFKIA